MELAEFAEGILFTCRLDDKLLFLRPEDLTDLHPFRSFLEPTVPGRPRSLDFSLHANKQASFPSFKEMKQDSGRGRVLHFFANHELLALELMALALLKFPDAPPSFRMNIGRTMLEEQHHLRLYLQRMTALGVGFGDIPVNDFFWQCLRQMQSPIDYVAGMSLTFEQANLDFSYHYWRLMQNIGDHDTADILHQVLQDEIGHVKFGVSWLDRWRDPELGLFATQERLLQAPLSMSRAKGIGFRGELRMQAGLSKSYIDQLEVHGGSKGRPPDIYWYNPDCENELAHIGRGYHLAANKQAMIADQSTLMMFIAKEGDLILCERSPSLSFLKKWKELGFPIPEFVCFQNQEKDFQKLRERPHVGSFYPWGWTRRALQINQRIFSDAKEKPSLEFLDEEEFDASPLRCFFRKDRLPQVRRRIRAEILHHEEYFGPSYVDGQRVEQLAELKEKLIGIWQNDQKEPAVVKPPFGSAGQNMRRLLSEEDWQSNMIGWLSHQLEQQEALLVEPWLDKLADFSVVWGVSGLRDETLTFFQTDHKGRYQGHALGAWQSLIDPGLKRELFSKRHDFSLTEVMLEAARLIRKDLADVSYHGPAGVDFPVFRDRHSGRVFVKCIGEINPRVTMGHISMSMERRLRAGKYLKAKQPACWRLLNQADLRHSGIRQAQQLLPILASLNKQLPIGQLLYPSSDPVPASTNISLLAIGADAIKILQEKFP